MRTIGSLPTDKQKRIAYETLTFFVVIAKNQNLEEIAQELEQRSLEILGAVT